MKISIERVINGWIVAIETHTTSPALGKVYTRNEVRVFEQTQDVIKFLMGFLQEFPQ